MPIFTVIVATYNWSAALKIALESVRDQTFTDFEVLVVGDACTDDSANVVQSLQDERFHWHNLPQNCGSQWGPNNHALAQARGLYVAYLGHDDLWWPTHLQTALETFENTHADIVAAATLLYGPKESGMRAVTGFFPHDRYTPMHFFPPSSMCHRLEIAQRIGGWRSPEEAMVVVDHDFLVRCHDAGAQIVPTGEFTTFKFNAAWRRNAYGLRNTTEQDEHLKLMRRDGEVFRRRELSATLRAAAEDRLLRIELPTRRDISATAKTAANQAFKGSHHHSPSAPLISSTGKQTYPARAEEAGFEWHGLEQHERLGPFRWSGPSTRSVLVLPVRLDEPVWISISVVHQLTRDDLATAELRVNGKQFATTLRPGAHGSLLWQVQVDPNLLPVDKHEAIHLEISLLHTHRPIDLGLGTDRRWLGLAIGTVTVEPVRCMA
ncbi:MAG: glycosyltransferase family 2 protein [Pseudomonadota bacterium]